MSWTASNPVSIGEATKKSHYDNLWDNADYLKDYIKGDNAEGSGASGHIHDNTNGLKVLFTNLDFTSSNLTSIETRNYSDLQNHDHATQHTNGDDDIQSATVLQKGVMTANAYEVLANIRRALVMANTNTSDYADATSAIFRAAGIIVTLVASTDEDADLTIFNSNQSDQNTFIIDTTERIYTINYIGLGAGNIYLKTIASGGYYKVQVKAAYETTSVYGFARTIGSSDGGVIQL